MTDDDFICTRRWEWKPDAARSTCLEHEACQDCHDAMTCGPCIDERRDDASLAAADERAGR